MVARRARSETVGMPMFDVPLGTLLDMPMLEMFPCCMGVQCDLGSECDESTGECVAVTTSTLPKPFIIGDTNYWTYEVADSDEFDSEGMVNATKWSEQLDGWIGKSVGAFVPVCM